MLDLLAEMFATPEAQADGYTWAAVTLAHAAVGALLTGLVALLGLTPWRAAFAASTAYAALWEGGQMALHNADLADSALDAAAVALGAFVAAAVWLHARRVLIALTAALAFMLARGVHQRRPKD